MFGYTVNRCVIKGKKKIKHKYPLSYQQLLFTDIYFEWKKKIHAVAYNMIDANLWTLKYIY